MRAGKLKTRRYRTRRRGGWALLAAAALLMIGYGLHKGWIALQWPVIGPGQPAATAQPAWEPPVERTVTLPGKSWYALQLGAFDNEAAAQALADAYRGRGAGGYLLQNGGCRVLAAAYPARAEAQAVQNQLKTQHGVDTVIVEITQPEITLRLTGPGSQLTALEDAYGAVWKLSEHASALSQALDQGRTDPETAAAALQSEQATLLALYRQLEPFCAASGSRAVSDMAQLLRDAEQALGACLNTSGKTRLGAQIKYCHLLAVCRMAAYAEALAQ